MNDMGWAALTLLSTVSELTRELNFEAAKCLRFHYKKKGEKNYILIKRTWEYKHLCWQVYVKKHSESKILLILIHYLYIYI